MGIFKKSRNKGKTVRIYKVVDACSQSADSGTASNTQNHNQTSTEGTIREIIVSEKLQKRRTVNVGTQTPGTYWVQETHVALKEMPMSEAQKVLKHLNPAVEIGHSVVNPPGRELGEAKRVQTYPQHLVSHVQRVLAAELGLNFNENGSNYDDPTRPAERLCRKTTIRSRDSSIGEEYGRRNQSPDGERWYERIPEREVSVPRPKRGRSVEREYYYRTPDGEIRRRVESIDREYARPAPECRYRCRSSTPEVRYSRSVHRRRETPECQRSSSYEYHNGRGRQGNPHYDRCSDQTCDLSSLLSYATRDGHKRNRHRSQDSYFRYPWDLRRHSRGRSRREKHHRSLSRTRGRSRKHRRARSRRGRYRSKSRTRETDCDEVRSIQGDIIDRLLENLVTKDSAGETRRPSSVRYAECRRHGAPSHCAIPAHTHCTCTMTPFVPHCAKPAAAFCCRPQPTNFLPQNNCMPQCPAINHVLSQLASSNITPPANPVFDYSRSIPGWLQGPTPTHFAHLSLNNPLPSADYSRSMSGYQQANTQASNGPHLGVNAPTPFGQYMENSANPPNPASTQVHLNIHPGASVTTGEPTQPAKTKPKRKLKKQPNRVIQSPRANVRVITKSCNCANDAVKTKSSVKVKKTDNDPKASNSKTSNRNESANNDTQASESKASSIQDDSASAKEISSWESTPNSSPRQVRISEENNHSETKNDSIKDISSWESSRNSTPRQVGSQNSSPRHAQSRNSSPHQVRISQDKSRAETKNAASQSPEWAKPYTAAESPKGLKGPKEHSCHPATPASSPRPTQVTTIKKRTKKIKEYQQIPDPPKRRLKGKTKRPKLKMRMKNPEDLEIFVGDNPENYQMPRKILTRRNFNGTPKQRVFAWPVVDENLPERAFRSREDACSPKRSSGKRRTKNYRQGPEVYYDEQYWGHPDQCGAGRTEQCSPRASSMPQQYPAGPTYMDPTLGYERPLPTAPPPQTPNQYYPPESPIRQPPFPPGYNAPPSNFTGNNPQSFYRPQTMSPVPPSVVDTSLGRPCPYSEDPGCAATPIPQNFTQGSVCNGGGGVSAEHRFGKAPLQQTTHISSPVTVNIGPETRERFSDRHTEASGPSAQGFSQEPSTLRPSSLLTTDPHLTPYSPRHPVFSAPLTQPRVPAEGYQHNVPVDGRVDTSGFSGFNTFQEASTLRQSAMMNMPNSQSLPFSMAYPSTLEPSRLTSTGPNYNMSGFSGNPIQPSPLSVSALGRVTPQPSTYSAYPCTSSVPIPQPMVTPRQSETYQTYKEYRRSTLDGGASTSPHRFSPSTAPGPTTGDPAENRRESSRKQNQQDTLSRIENLNEILDRQYTKDLGSLKGILARQNTCIDLASKLLDYLHTKD